jgi:hypothetical protein
MESSSGSSRPAAGREFSVQIHQEVKKLLLKNYVVWWIRLWTAKLYEQQQKFSLRKHGFLVNWAPIENSCY